MYCANMIVKSTLCKRVKDLIKMRKNLVTFKTTIILLHLQTHCRHISPDFVANTKPFLSAQTPVESSDLRIQRKIHLLQKKSLIKPSLLQL